MSIIVSVTGLECAGVTIPRLEIHAQDVIDLHWPCKHLGREEMALGEFLAKECAQSGVRVAACAAFPQAVLPSRSFIRERRLGDFRKACDPELLVDWVGIEQEFSCGSEDRVGHLRFTSRVLFALLLGMSQSRFVQYTTAGLDPLGTERVQELVQKFRDRGWTFLRCVSESSGSEVRVVRRGR